jgi:cytochrome P450
VYDPFSDQSRIDPYPAYAVLREESPLYFDSKRNFWALSRHSDVHAALSDWRTYSSAEGLNRGGDLMDMDPPVHGRVRRILSPHLRSGALRSLEPFIRQTSRRLLERAGVSDFDLTREFALPLPALVTARLLGLADRDASLVANLSSELISPGEGSIGSVARMRARAALADVLLARVTQGTDDPSRDMLGALASAVRREAIALADVPGLCLMLLVAGIEPTASLLTSIVHALATSQVAVEEFLAPAGQVRPAAVDEFLRYEAPVQWVSRVTTSPVSLYSQVIPRGSRVLLLIGSANRDPRRYRQPDAFDPRREHASPATFGFGVHACLGIPLARMQARIALEVVLARLRGLRLAGPTERSSSHVLRGFARLPVAGG